MCVCVCVCVHDWNAEQLFHHLFATLQLGGRHCLVGFIFSEWHFDVCEDHQMPLEAADKTIICQQVNHCYLVDVDL